MNGLYLDIYIALQSMLSDKYILALTSTCKLLHDLSHQLLIRTPTSIMYRHMPRAHQIINWYAHTRQSFVLQGLQVQKFHLNINTVESSVELCHSIHTLILNLTEHKSIEHSIHGSLSHLSAFKFVCTFEYALFLHWHESDTFKFEMYNAHQIHIHLPLSLTKLKIYGQKCQTIRGLKHGIHLQHVYLENYNRTFRFLPELKYLKIDIMDGILERNALSSVHLETLILNKFQNYIVLNKNLRVLHLPNFHNIVIRTDKLEHLIDLNLGVPSIKYHLPSTLTRVKFYHIDHALVLPSSVTHFTCGVLFDTTVHLPSTITSLSINNYKGIEMDRDTWMNLKVFTRYELKSYEGAYARPIYDTFWDYWDYPYTDLSPHLIRLSLPAMLHIQQPLIHLTYLQLWRDDNINYALTPHLKKLMVRYHARTTYIDLLHLKTLNIRTLMRACQFPDTLKKLIIHDNFPAHYLTKLPNHLRVLKLIDYDHELFCPLPPTLIKLVLPNYFEKDDDWYDLIQLPLSLRYLQIGKMHDIPHQVRKIILH